MDVPGSYLQFFISQRCSFASVIITLCLIYLRYSMFFVVSLHISCFHSWIKFFFNFPFLVLAPLITFKDARWSSFGLFEFIYFIALIFFSINPQISFHYFIHHSWRCFLIYYHIILIIPSKVSIANTVQYNTYDKSRKVNFIKIFS